MPDVRLKQIWIAGEAKAAPSSVRTTVVKAHRGIVGDRYHAGFGRFSRFASNGRPVTLISYEALIDIRARLGSDLISEGLHRRNLVISGCRAVEKLMNHTFRIGSVVFTGQQPAQPCRFLEKSAPSDA